MNLTQYSLNPRRNFFESTKNDMLHAYKIKDNYSNIIDRRSSLTVHKKHWSLLLDGFV